MSRALPARARGSAFLLAAALATAAPGATAAQEPPDTLAPDTLQQAPDSLDQAADSAQADTIFYNLPAMDAGAPDGWDRGVWSWDHEEIMATAANTLAELVADVPGLVTLLGGDYGAPKTLSAFGSGGGGLRVIRDGFEVLPLDGGVPDLSRIGLAGIRRVRLDRRAGALQIEMWSFVYEDGRPYSLVEAGTGDLDTNFFRGLYADPTALGGSLAGGLERTDTRGPLNQEPGNRTGWWLRYQLHRGNAFGVAFETRRATSDNSLDEYAARVRRSDATIRARARLAEGLAAEAYVGRSTHAVDDERDPYRFEGGRRAQQGLRLSYEGYGAWARAEGRRFGGGDLPASRLDLGAGYARAPLGGVDAGLERAAWPDTTLRNVRVRGWVGPVLGLSAFASYETGAWGSRLGPPVAYPDSLMVDPDTLPRAWAPTERTAIRVGASARWRDAMVSGALLRVEADSLLPLSLELDRGEPILPGARREGFELWARVPTLWEGFFLQGSLQQWESTGPYLPEQIYRGAFVYHRLFRENLELWWNVGVRGRDPMAVHRVDAAAPVPGTLETVPFFQSWDGRIQIRIVTMRIYIAWENFAVRRDLQDFPGRVLPHTRTVYGIRWTLWN